MKLFIRHRINECISMLQSNNYDLNLLYSSKYADAMHILESNGCIKVTRAYGGDVVLIKVLDLKISTYQLSRHDIWANRIGGFLSGVAISVAAEIIIRFIF